MVIHRVTDDSPRADIEAALHVLVEKRARAELAESKSELTEAINELLEQLYAQLA